LRIFHRCILPSFRSIGFAVSEEKIKMWKANGRQMTDAKWWQKLTLPLARWAKNDSNEGYIIVELKLQKIWSFRWIFNFTKCF
jgi:hypothetical protein